MNITINRPQYLQAGLCRGIHELLFSLTVGLTATAIVINSVQPNRVRVFFRLARRINSILHLYEHNVVGETVALFALAAALAACLFLLLRLFWRTSFARELLRSVAGIVAFVAPFTCWFYLVRGYARLVDVFLALEVGAYVLCVLFYLSRRWPHPAWAVVLCLAVHYVLWGWLFWRDIFNPAMLAVPVTAFFSSLVWVLYVSHLFSAPSGITRSD